MARGKWLERNEEARAAVKKATADYKAKWAEENEVRAAVMTGEKCLPPVKPWNLLLS